MLHVCAEDHLHSDVVVVRCDAPAVVVRGDAPAVVVRCDIQTYGFLLLQENHNHNLLCSS